MSNHNPDLRNLIMYKPGQSGNLKGRPRKWTSFLKDFGYKKSEVIDCIQNIIGMNKEELNEVVINPKATVLEVTVAGAIIKSIQNKSLYSIETLLTRIYGQPKQEIEQEIKGDIKITFNLDGSNTHP